MLEALGYLCDCLSAWACRDDVIRPRPLRQSEVPSIGVRRRRKFGEVSCTECTGQANDFELIPTAKMETRLPVEGSSSNKFPSIYNHCGVMAAWSRNAVQIFLDFCRRPLTRKFSKLCSERIHCDTDRRVAFKFREIWPTEIGKIVHTVRARKWVQYSAEA